MVFISALWPRSLLRSNQAESVCSQASGCSAAPACRECGVFKERQQADWQTGRQAGSGNSGSAERRGWRVFHACGVTAERGFRRRENNRTCDWGGKKHESSLSQTRTRRFENNGGSVFAEGGGSTRDHPDLCKEIKAAQKPTKAVIFVAGAF